MQEGWRRGTWESWESSSSALLAGGCPGGPIISLRRGDQPTGQLNSESHLALDQRRSLLRSSASSWNSGASAGSCRCWWAAAPGELPLWIQECGVQLLQDSGAASDHQAQPAGSPVRRAQIRQLFSSVLVLSLRDTRFPALKLGSRFLTQYRVGAPGIKRTEAA